MNTTFPPNGLHRLLILLVLLASALIGFICDREAMTLAVRAVTVLAPVILGVFVSVFVGQAFVRKGDTPLERRFATIFSTSRLWPSCFLNVYLPGHQL